ncbi:uncharacterized protein LOC141617683 [Silene latifolia]|uniref:uncharacterized protein LOC141617683 n=1 Tax=Silene latifolia TaxID=37657 RepID=UPI003D7714EE
MYSNEGIGLVVRDAEMIPFQNTMAACDLQDLKTTGAFFAWTNKQPSATRGVLIICLVEGSTTTTVRRKSFKFFNMWSRVPDFHVVVAQGWHVYYSRTPMFRLVQKLKSLKPLLKELNRSLFSDIERNAVIAHKFLLECKQKLHLDPVNTALIDMEYQARESYLMLSIAKDDFLRQKAKVNWAKDGDTNSAMFHKAIKHRQIQNKVLLIEDAEGHRSKNPEDILQAFVRYYEQLLGYNSPT